MGQACLGVLTLAGKLSTPLVHQCTVHVLVACWLDVCLLIARETQIAMHGARKSEEWAASKSAATMGVLPHVPLRGQPLLNTVAQALMNSSKLLITRATVNIYTAAVYLAVGVKMGSITSVHTLLLQGHVGHSHMCIIRKRPFNTPYQPLVACLWSSTGPYCSIARSCLSPQGGPVL